MNFFWFCAYLSGCSRVSILDRGDSIGQTGRGKAERVAADLEKQLNQTQASGDGAMPWESFLDLYQIRHLSGLERATDRKILWGFGARQLFRRWLFWPAPGFTLLPFQTQFLPHQIDSRMCPQNRFHKLSHSRGVDQARDGREFTEFARRDSLDDFAQDRVKLVG